MGEQAARKLDPHSVDQAQIADGIYFDLDEEAYHLDEALGSSDHRKLLENPCRLLGTNRRLIPIVRQNETRRRYLRGRAMHKLVLEGEDAFAGKYWRIEHTEDMTPAEKSAVTKAANKHAEATGKTTLPADTYDRVVLAAAMITRNPKLAGAFTNGMPGSEHFLDAGWCSAQGQDRLPKAAWHRRSKERSPTHARSVSRPPAATTSPLTATKCRPLSTWKRAA